MEGRERESEAERPEGKHETGMERDRMKRSGRAREGEGVRGPGKTLRHKPASRRRRQGCMQPPSWRNT